MWRLAEDSVDRGPKEPTDSTVDLCPRDVCEPSFRGPLLFEWFEDAPDAGKERRDVRLSWEESFVDGL